ncbi:flagellar biosynthesis protein FlhB [Aquincola sp. S2]|uniref:Flagellar biosynthetic protein FlhB n=1 Tax=Pseudaquabacterium terrae TaxID=2732868 RepID=A0ABX2EP02_9BURK|nr:flagellar biosynthesis protein FlhB [Aquabacterium terrae]NRF70304.1 flagellar biosynthesis protein FlhB [Aquabacterium terrae]
MADAQDRNLPASERKIRKSREDGQVARSRDLAHLAMVGGGGALLVAFAPALAGWMQKILALGLRFDAKLLTQPDVLTHRLGELAAGWLLVLLVIGGVGLALAIGSGVAAGGWNFTMKPLAPKFDKLNPLTGIGRMFSADHLSQVGKACLLALLLGVIGAFYLKGHLAEFHDALSMPLPQAMKHTTQALLGGLMLLVIALVVFAAIDVPLQRFMLLKRLKMSHQEMKQEYKDAEGNVEVKAKVKARMREMAKKRMLAAVPSADLVVMNPTHYAVALKYEDSKMAAPRVVAKGADLVAMKIRDIARENKVPVLQSPALARALYAHTEVDQEVPQRLFSAVAQVLAYVYQLRAALAGRGKMPADLAPIVVPPDLDPHNKPATGAADEADEA